MVVYIENTTYSILVEIERNFAKQMPKKISVIQNILHELMTLFMTLMTLLTILMTFLRTLTTYVVHKTQLRHKPDGLLVANGVQRDLSLH